MTPAFPGGAAQKAAALEAVRAAIADGRYLHENEGDTVNGLAGCIVAGGDLRVFERETGIPGTLANLASCNIDGLTSTISVARERALAWIEAVQPGSDLSLVPTRMAVWLIDEFARTQAVVPAALTALRDLHQRQLAGEAVPRSAWAAVRGDIVAANGGDPAREEPSASDSLMEALAWPAATSRTQLAEGARILARSMTPQTYMSAETYRETRAVMEALYEETAAEREANPENYFFPPIFEARYPEMSGRFVADLQRLNACFADSVNRTADQALTLIRAAAPAHI